MTIKSKSAYILRRYAGITGVSSVLQDMPEGPSIVILKEEISPFAGKTVLRVEGNSKAGIARLQGQKLKSVRSWGKHLLLCFSGYYVRIHLLMFGSYRINERKENQARLRLEFGDGEFSLYACSVKLVDGDPCDDYDWTVDTMSTHWDPLSVLEKVREGPNRMICDVLLDQNIFAGVGNIIKCEILFISQVHPGAKVKNIPDALLQDLVIATRAYCFDFYKWKRAFVLRKHWQIYRKSICPRCGIKVVISYMGLTNRRTFFCGRCQFKTKRELQNYENLKLLNI